MNTNPIVNALSGITGRKKVALETPENEQFGDYTTNIAMQLFSHSPDSQMPKILKFKSPRELAQDIVNKLKTDAELMKVIDKIEVAGPGFINFWLSPAALLYELQSILVQKEKYGSTDVFKGKKIMVEYAHPNTHKELHIGHMRTLILGESLARIFKNSGAKVFRANYQGDIGPHVAKAIWGTQKILEERKISWEDAENMNIYERTHLLGEGYVQGVKDYEERKSEIDELNSKLYRKEASVQEVYQKTKKWSLDYYEAFYKRFGTHFDKLYFESQVGLPGKDIVLANLNKVFEKSEGAIIFDGEKYGLHKRVFVTKDGNPTYEAKDMALAPMQFKNFPFDLNIHVVANEQKGYFQVIIKALELVEPKLKGREYHLPMGMVNLVGQKMSSRTGVVVTVDKLLDDIKKQVVPLIGDGVSDKDRTAEIITIGAVKYSMLKVNPESEVLFNMKESISLEGNSGPYLQYTFARCQSVARKAGTFNFQPSVFTNKHKLNQEELGVMKSLAHFGEIIEVAAKGYAPNLICNYLYDLAQKYNSFYNKYKIVGSDEEDFRLTLTVATGQVLKNGLGLLGIEAPEKM